ncbi:insulinase family protein [Candidatus Pacearchaeota archaeon]|nr:insulinase family protein [Candidatus Pacearchaeota archaeon]
MQAEFYKKKLKNGMTILLEKRNLPIVSVAFAVRAGGINETAQEKGISHYIEHMLYKGTPSRNTQKIASEIERKGGILNGFTADAITAFWCKMPSKHLDTALDVLSDMIKNPLFDKKELEKERKVIFEEIKMRRDNPLIYVYDKIQSYLYKPPFGIPLIGTYESMNSLDKNKILEKFRQVYRPNNLVLCVVGNADFGNLASFVEKTFGNEKGIIFQPKIQLKDEEGTEDREGIDQANMVFAYHAPLAQNKLSYAALVLNTLMAGGMSSRLFSEIREKRNLAYAVKGEENTTKDFSYNMIYIGAMKENIEKIKSLILGEFDKVASSLDENELNDVKNHVIGNHQISMEDSQGQMVNLLLHEIDGKVEDFYNFEKNILNVKLKEVQQLARIKKYSFFALAPK